MRLRNLALLSALICTAMSTVAAAAPYTLSDHEGRFTIEMPGPAEREARRSVNPGARRHVVWSFTNAATAEQWLVFWAEYETQTTPAQYVRGGANAFEKLLGVKVLKSNAIENNGIKFSEYYYALPKGNGTLAGRTRQLVVGARLYTISYLGPQNNANTERVTAFLNSFRYQKPTGDEIALDESRKLCTHYNKGDVIIPCTTAIRTTEKIMGELQATMPQPDALSVEWAKASKQRNTLHKSLALYYGTRALNQGELGERGYACSDIAKSFSHDKDASSGIDTILDIRDLAPQHMDVGITENYTQLSLDASLKSLKASLKCLDELNKN